VCHSARWLRVSNPCFTLVSDWLDGVHFQPKLSCGSEGIYSCSLPPSDFVSTSMNFSMMSTAQGNGELVADFTPECSALRKTQMMGVRRTPAAYQTWLFRDMSYMRSVTNAAQFGQCKYALVDFCCARTL
jgi:hypothetical protein